MGDFPDTKNSLLPSISKRCSRCKNNKNFSEFNKDKSSKIGYAHVCKTCRKLERIRDRSKNVARAKKWAENNREKSRAIKAKWRLANPEYRKQHYENNKEEYLENTKAWIANNRDKHNQYVHNWASKNESKKRTYEARRNEIEARLPGNFTTKQWLDLCNYYGNAYVYCKADSKLTVDHIIPATWEGSSNDISNIQPLYGRCNSGKQNRHATNYKELLWLFEGLPIFE